MISFRKKQEQLELVNLSPYAKKSVNAKRWKEEDADPYRTDYQRDIGRIVFSDAFRRMRMKTQVFLASGTDQHNRTRLTHSLEVAQISKSIAKPLGLNIDLTEAVALGHDLGHTPYGHAGESALNTCLRGKGIFNHNAQSVWILRQTLQNRKDRHGKVFPGYNLTYDVVEGIWKHTEYKHTLKEFDGLQHYNPDGAASLEGQTVDIADGIAYLTHDIEDSVRNNLISMNEVEEIWGENTEVDFRPNTWRHHLIYDVIAFSDGKEFINFSPDTQCLYTQLKSLVKNKILNSEKVKKTDEEGKEKICAIYDYYSRNPEVLINKWTNRNTYINNKG